MNIKKKNKFWQEKSLAEMSPQEWEALCDRCGRCCLNKLEDIDDGQFYYTDVACALFDKNTHGCKDYQNRQAKVPGCVKLSRDNIYKIKWLPSTCAYRLLLEKKPLPAWHPLLSGTYQSVIRAGIAVGDRVYCERDILEQDLEEHVIDWVTT
ncbi:YcgN family cysteine cluster protein [Piscirickettsia salmonis]|nr:YcgN family cysteine cluster protein [Piscirickettsia salmonis]AKP72228.1 hypothetical protein PSLF89_7 [Piscirickettsia salmonis LF-89 = ATCC VR-1361]ALY04125.1 hypothetical protein AWE47_15685 [Piscirickettsia salmonis]AMA43680.1 hypothetical protein AWJ11_15855 [Piscirickettsia salmonis]AOS36147.1 hypothetical protein AVM72_12960 [Piscirickettsia salmonis]APS60844.1 hypothetical protein AVI53_09925 [Piscirickettsia salmonis]